MKQDDTQNSGREGRGGALGAPKLANELLKDNLHMSERRRRGRDRKGESEENEICRSGVDNPGRGAESLSPRPPGEGERRWWWGPPSGELLEQIM